MSISARSEGRLAEVRVVYRPSGAAAEIFHCKEPEVLVSGPAGTGKSRSCLEKVHLMLSRHAGARGLMVRKTRTSLTNSGMITFRDKVLHPMDGVRWRGDQQHYEYPNGSVLVVAGLDKASKVMSAEYDVVYVQEATELLVGDWEAITTRLRNGVIRYQQLIADCNPDAPTHWLRQRCDAGRCLMLESRHIDNPVLWDAERGEWTAAGAAYIAKLDALTGVRHRRLRDGAWAAAEGMVYDGWDRAIHLVDAVPVRPGQKVDPAGIPVDWLRYWVVDFGFTNPFCWQAWCVDPDGRAYLYQEIYRVKGLVEDHARRILAVTAGQPVPRAIVCDHDAEDRATLEKYLRMRTVPAHKAISAGVQAVAARLRVAGDGRPRLFVVRGALVERDRDLDEAKRPCCSEEEVDGYVWPKGADGKPAKEQPVGVDDHGMDDWRYLVAQLDLEGGRKATGRARPEGREGMD